MNGGTNKGQADGFNVKALTKLDGTKDRTNRITLLHYIAELANKKDPDCMRPLVEQFECIHEAKGISIESITQQMQTISDGLKRFA
jgi:Formin Homology 2 Domain